MTDLDRLRATAHPLRLRLLSLLTGDAFSAAQAARELGETQANVSYHLRVLERAGLLEVAEVVPVRGGRAKRYRHTVSSEPFVLDPLDASSVSADEHASRGVFVDAMAGELTRRVRRLSAGAQVFTDAELWVGSREWSEVVELVGRASAMLHAAARAPRSADTIPVTMTAALFELDQR